MTAQAVLSHVEWRCRDLLGTCEFLRELLGWQFRAMGSRFAECVPDQGPKIGLLQCAERVGEGDCQGFVRVDAIRSKLRKAVELGGEIIESPQTIPNYGYYGRIQTPDGTVLGLFSECLGDG
ncbi:MAG: hypothetical protein SVU69_09885 [Pseudomonadota bacterium]|nr:hypothetical protein [Pseudomonadota bacterium]